MSKLFRIQKSFSARLSLWVTLAVAVVLIFTAIVTNIFVLIAVETAVKNHVGEIGFFLHAPREEMYRITRMLLETNPAIVGSAIAFEPNYYSEQGRWFSPYSYSDGTTIFLFTDGLTEAENTYHAQFNLSRVKEVATEALACQEHEPKQIIQRMSEAVHQFVGDAQQSDDLTMFAIQYIKHYDVGLT